MHSAGWHQGRRGARPPCKHLLIVQLVLGLNPPPPTFRLQTCHSPLRAEAKAKMQSKQPGALLACRLGWPLVPGLARSIAPRIVDALGA